MSDASWLELPQVTSTIKLPNETARFPGAAKKLAGRSRVWACDGEFLILRRKKANPATLQRHETFLKTGDYVYLTTQDDVEVYKLMPSSPFKRKQRDLTTIDSYNLRREAALAACRREWPLFVDALMELSGRIKGQYHDAFAKTVYDENLTAIFLAINMRGGPTRAEIDREVQALRKRRGDSVSALLVPAGIRAA